MSKFASIFTLLTAVLACALVTTPALAQRDRVFVASYGSDSNPCTFGSPCKTFQNAVNVVAAGGEFTAIDSAGFGTITISHAVTITSPNGVEAGIATPASGTAITITAGANDVINLNGLTLDGVGSANFGIMFNSGGRLNIQNCVIRSFANDGIDFVPNASSTLSVSNTLVAENSVDGIFISPTNTGTVTAVLDHVEADNNSDGLLVIGNANPGAVQVTVSDSVFTRNNIIGIVASTPNGGPVAVMVRNSTIADNSTLGILANFNATIRVTRSTITGSTTGWGTMNGGAIDTYNDNNLDGNATNGTASNIILTH